MNHNKRGSVLHEMCHLHLMCQLVITPTYTLNPNPYNHFPHPIPYLRTRSKPSFIPINNLHLIQLIQHHLHHTDFLPILPHLPASFLNDNPRHRVG